jgi:type 1 glutamine amidotransferase
MKAAKQMKAVCRPEPTTGLWIERSFLEKQRSSSTSVLLSALAIVCAVLLSGSAHGAGKPEASATYVPRIEQMPRVPTPYVLRDWQQDTRDYLDFVFEFDCKPRVPGSQPVGGGRIKVLLVGGRGHDWKGFHDTIAPVIEKTGAFQLSLTEKLDDLKADNFSKYKVILFYGSGGDFSDPKQEEGLLEFVKKGGGLAGVHATDAFKKSDVHWRLLGGRFTTHGGGKFWLRIEDKQHPITKGVEDFEIQDETYQSEYHPDFKLHSLGRIDRGNEQQSIIWVQEYGNGRVFNTTLGHDGAAWTNPNFQRLLVRGLYWAAGREPKDIPPGKTE